MSTITDWLMVFITLGYVVATIFILIANNRSAKATREQIEVSQSQFEETKRLEVMPSLSVSIKEKVNGNFGWGKFPYRFFSDIPQNENSYQESKPEYYLLYLENIGSGSARDVCLKLNNAKGNSTNIGSIMVGQTIEVYCEFTGTFIGKTRNDTGVELIIEYSDLLKNNYSQTTSLVFHTDEHSFDATYRLKSDIHLMK